jgi:hypothetical protein
MLNFHLISVVHVLWMLDFCEKSPVTRAVPKPRPANIGLLAAIGDSSASNEISEMAKDDGRGIIKETTELAGELDLRSTKHRLSQFELKLRFAMTKEEYLNEIKVLREALKHDLSECHFYHYPRAKLEVLMKFYPSWNSIKAAFPLVESEALCATDCYALGHNTASVFHTMRVAEYGLRAVAKERKLVMPKNKLVDWSTWQEVIRELGKETIRIGEKASAGSAKDNALSFYSGALSDLNAFKDEYRNQVMHVRKEYNEHQALRALVKVHAFMERVAEKISYKHHRIRWGLRFKPN